jgi:hypothetical protein
MGYLLDTVCMRCSYGGSIGTSIGTCSTCVRRTDVRFDLYPQGVDNHRGWYSQGVDNYYKWSFSDPVRRFSGLLFRRAGRAWGGTPQILRSSPLLDKSIQNV